MAWYVQISETNTINNKGDKLQKTRINFPTKEEAIAHARHIVKTNQLKFNQLIHVQNDTTNETLSLKQHLNGIYGYNFKSEEAAAEWGRSLAFK